MGLKGAFRWAAHGCSASPLAHPVDGPLAPIPFSLHPDYDRRPRDHTGSADLAAVLREQFEAPSARGLCALRAITAGGELHPALRTLPPEPWRRRVFTIHFEKLHRVLVNIDYRQVCWQLHPGAGLIFAGDARSNRLQQGTPHSQRQI